MYEAVYGHWHRGDLHLRDELHDFQSDSSDGGPARYGRSRRSRGLDISLHGEEAYAEASSA